MAIKFTRSDDLDKMFEEFATLPKIEKVEFPDEKEKKTKKEQKARKSCAFLNNCHLVCYKLVRFSSPLLSKHYLLC